MKHPDVIPYARFLVLTEKQREATEHHLKLCGKCRDLVLFVRKTIATLGSEGAIARVAQALCMDVEFLKHHIDAGTPIGTVIAERTFRTILRTPGGRFDQRAFEGSIEKTAELRAKRVTQVERRERKARVAQAPSDRHPQPARKLQDVVIKK